MRAAVEAGPAGWGAGRVTGGALGLGLTPGALRCQPQRAAAGTTSWSQNREEGLLQDPHPPLLMQGPLPS